MLRTYSGDTQSCVVTTGFTPEKLLRFIPVNAVQPNALGGIDCFAAHDEERVLVGHHGRPVYCDWQRIGLSPPSTEAAQFL